jgi:hypothetical protein
MNDIPPNARPQEGPERKGGEAPAPMSAGGRGASRSRRAVESTSLSGRKIGGYEIKEVLGRGGMGTVYKARQVNMERWVALKVLAPEMANDSKYIIRFFREARAAGALNHGNIVQVYDVAEDQGYYFFSMEYVEGESLRRKLRNETRLEPLTALGYIAQMARALAHAKKSGLVHRDIKPDNILVTPAGVAKLADLGLAKITAVGDDPSQTKAGLTMGTPHYMSPEQTKSGAAADHRSDIYSLGATFYHLVTGFVPFDASSPMEVMLKACREKAVPAHEREPSVPRAVSDLIARMMEKDPGRRPQDAEALTALIEKTRSTLLEAEGSDTHVDSAPVGVRSTAWGAARAALTLGAVALSAATVVMALDEKGAAPPPPLIAFAAPATHEEKTTVKIALSHDEQAAQALQAARDWQRGHPSEYAEAIKRFEDAARQFTDTPAGSDARKMAADIRQRWDLDGAWEQDRRRRLADRLSEHKFLGDAARVLASFPAVFASTPAAAEARNSAGAKRKEAVEAAKTAIGEARADLAAGYPESALVRAAQVWSPPFGDVLVEEGGEFAGAQAEAENIAARAATASGALRVGLADEERAAASSGKWVVEQRKTALNWQFAALARGIREHLAQRQVPDPDWAALYQSDVDLLDYLAAGRSALIDALNGGGAEIDLKKFTVQKDIAVVKSADAERISVMLGKPGMDVRPETSIYWRDIADGQVAALVDAVREKRPSPRLDLFMAAWHAYRQDEAKATANLGRAKKAAGGAAKAAELEALLDARRRLGAEEAAARSFRQARLAALDGRMADARAALDELNRTSAGTATVKKRQWLIQRLSTDAGDAAVRAAERWASGAVYRAGFGRAEVRWSFAAVSGRKEFEKDWTIDGDVSAGRDGVSAKGDQASLHLRNCMSAPFSAAFRFQVGAEADRIEIRIDPGDNTAPAVLTGAAGRFGPKTGASTALDKGSDHDLRLRVAGGEMFWGLDGRLGGSVPLSEGRPSIAVTLAGGTVLFDARLRGMPSVGDDK